MSNLSELLPSGGGQNQIDFVASGTLPNGKPVILKSNGQIEVVAETTNTTTASIPNDDEVVYSGDNGFPVSEFVSNTSNKFVMVWVEQGGGWNVKSIVGTISGSSINFGSAQVLTNHYLYDMDISFQPLTNKFILVGSDGWQSRKGVYAVGTVSGTSISWGSLNIFNSGAAHKTSICFDPNQSGRFIIGYKNASNNNFGYVVAGLRSGNSASFNTPINMRSVAVTETTVEFDPSTTGSFIFCCNTSSATQVMGGTLTGSSIAYSANSYTAFGDRNTGGGPKAAFNPVVAGQFIVATMVNMGGGQNLIVIVGNKTGNHTISAVGTYGTASSSVVVVNTGNTYYPDIRFDSFGTGSNKFIVAYRNPSNNHYGTIRIGSISSNTITLASPIVMNSKHNDYLRLSFDKNAMGSFIISYKNDSTNNGVSSGVMANSRITTNLTSTNLIGIAAEAASSGATAKINTWGGINESQTSLTIGSDYYAQTNGTITTATGGQKLGTAISATTINIRDLP